MYGGTFGILMKLMVYHWSPNEIYGVPLEAPPDELYCVPLET